MTLSNKTALSFLASAFVVAALGGVFSHYLLMHVFDREATEQLKAQQVKILREIDKTTDREQKWFALADSISIENTNFPVKESLCDTLLPNPLETGEMLDYRILIFGVKTHTGYVKVTISKALYETEDLAGVILLIFSVVLLGLIIALLIINYIISNRLWRPFYQALQQLQSFKIQEQKPLSFMTTTTKEFGVLQQNIDHLTQRIWHDYNSLKQFTENASHEFQTPLAVIQSNLEQLIQSDNLHEKQLTKISELIESVRHLSKLNQTLLLLVKIENQQFTETVALNLGDLFKQKLKFWEVWTTHKALEVSILVDKEILLNINPYLAEVLLNNLLGNAIKHNIPQGIITIKLTDNSLIISNTGNEPLQATEKLWQRFQKGNHDSDSHGLGMALIRQICEFYGYEVHYQYSALLHTVKIAWK